MLRLAEETIDAQARALTAALGIDWQSRPVHPLRHRQRRTRRRRRPRHGRRCRRGRAKRAGRSCAARNAAGSIGRRTRAAHAGTTCRLGTVTGRQAGCARGSGEGKLAVTQGGGHGDRADAERGSAGAGAGGAGPGGSRDRICVRHFRRPYRAHRPGSGAGAEPGAHGDGARGVAGRRDGRGLRPADPAARRDDRAGAVGARQRADRHARSLSVVVADAAADRFQRRAALSPARALSAGDRRLRQLGRAPRVRRRHQAGDAGAGAGRRGAGDAARDQARDGRPARAGRGAVRPRRAGRHGGARSRSRCCIRPATICRRRRRRPTRRRSRRPPSASSPPSVRSIIAGNGVRIAQAYEQLRDACRDRRDAGRRRPPPARAAFAETHPLALGVFGTFGTRGGECLPRRGRSGAGRRLETEPERHRLGEHASCSTRRGRLSSRSISSRATPRGISRPRQVVLGDAAQILGELCEAVRPRAGRRGARRRARVARHREAHGYLQRAGLRRGRQADPAAAGDRRTDAQPAGRRRSSPATPARTAS